NGLKVALTVLQYTPGPPGAIALRETVTEPPPAMGFKVTIPDPVVAHTPRGQPQLTNVNPLGNVSSKLIPVVVGSCPALWKVSVNVTGLPAITFGETIFPATIDTHLGNGLL